MSPHVGFYVHHHGLGHLTRAGAVLAHLRSRATVLTSADASCVDLSGAGVLPLPLDTDAGEGTLPGPPLRGLHYAPVGSRGLQERTVRIAAWAAARRPDLLVVDVSAEVSLLGRLLALPVVTVRQHGRRWDPAHLAAYGASHALLASYSKELEEPDAPPWVTARTFYSGGFSRYDHRIGAAVRDASPASPRTRRRVTVLLGTGGSDLDHGAVARAAAASPGWEWTVIGGLRGAPASNYPFNHPSNLIHLPWTDDVFGYLLRSDAVVASGSHNSVMEVAAAGRPLVCLPQRRPFNEQRSKAARLEALGAAVVRDGWPRASEWPGVLEEALRIGPAALASLVDDNGARRAAAFLDGLARDSAVATGREGRDPQSLAVPAAAAT